MRISRQERLAVAGMMIMLIGLPVLLANFTPDRMVNKSVRTITLTGVMKSGVWTEDEVTAVNYPWKSFKPATIRMETGDEILLRLTSADVIHSFYVPDLHPEPILVEPGHYVELRLHGKHPGIYPYYCVTVCGDCHYSMRGQIIVGSPPESGMDALAAAATHACLDHAKPSPELSFVETGKQLYESMGCMNCHGRGGSGGIRNPNYIKQSVPALDDLADRMWIYWEEDAETIIKLLEAGIDLTTFEADDPIENFSRFQAQYKSMRTKIIAGAPHVQKMNPEGPNPPLVMPSWETKLSPRDMDAVIAYLIDQFDWSIYDE